MSKSDHAPSHSSTHSGKPHKDHSHAWKVRHGQALPIWNIVILVALGLVLLAALVVIAFKFFG